MKKFVFILASFLSISQAWSQDKVIVPCERSFVEISEKAESKIIPDEIYLEITLDEKDEKGRSGLDELEIKLKRVLTALGIDLKNLSVTYASSDFHKRFFGKDIYVSKRYELKLRSVEDVDKTLAALKSQGISNISVSRADYSKREETKQALRAQALKRVKQKAETLLQSIGERIGRPLSISIQEYSEAYPALLSLKNQRAVTEGKTEFDETAFRPIVLRVEVWAKFEIK